MGHHSGYPFEQSMSEDQLNELFEKFKSPKAPQPLLGPTGEFPMGKLVEKDEGEIRIGIKSFNDKIVIEFGKPIHWIGFSPEQARQVAESLIKHASGIEAQPKDSKG